MRRTGCGLLAAGLAAVAVAASSRRPSPGEQRHRRDPDHDRRAHSSSPQPPSFARASRRSATIRTSTPGSSSIRRWGSGARSRASPRAGPAAAQQHVRGPALAGDLGDGRGHVVGLLDQHAARRAPRRAGAAPVSERSCSSDRLGPGGRTHSRSRSAPSRWAERHARRTSRWAPGYGSTSASSRSPTACGRVGGERLLARAHRFGGGQALVADLLGHLAQRDLAQRREVLDPEEVVQRGVDALRRIDLARPQPIEQRLRA